MGYECSITSDDVLSSDEGKKKEEKSPSENKTKKNKVADGRKNDEDICRFFIKLKNIENYIFLLSVCLEINGRAVSAKDKLMHYSRICGFEVSFLEFNKRLLKLC